MKLNSPSIACFLWNKNTEKIYNCFATNDERLYINNIGWETSIYIIQLYNNIRVLVLFQISRGCCKKNLDKSIRFILD